MNSLMLAYALGFLVIWFLGVYIAVYRRPEWMKTAGAGFFFVVFVIVIVGAAIGFFASLAMV